MTVKIVPPSTVFECSMCPKWMEEHWHDLASAGWRSYYAGSALEPIVLCPACESIIAERRGARTAELREAA